MPAQLSCLIVVGVLCAMTGCAVKYPGVVQPVPRLSSLSPELEHLTDAAIDTYLKADVKPGFPTVLAVACVSRGHRDDYTVEPTRGQEAAGFKQLEDLKNDAGQSLVNQVQLVSPMLCSGKVSLKSLRDAAALLHAPLLIVYTQADDIQEGQNSAAMAYWTIVGWFTVPGNTVGRWSLCQALVIDTQTGFILATAQGESKREENVLPGAIDIARHRLEITVPVEAATDLHKSLRSVLIGLAQRSQRAQ